MSDRDDLRVWAEDRENNLYSMRRRKLAVLALLDELAARDAAIEKLREAFASYRTRGGWDDFVRALRTVLDSEETQ